MAAVGHWDIFCKVIDNYGDVGVCWRLAADLTARAQKVRLWCDDVSALQWLAPESARPGVAGPEVVPWTDSSPRLEPGDVVIEAFGCDPPPDFVQTMAQRRSPPVWINLEYLSAEPWVERCHGRPSPQSGGPGAGLTKWFFYPGFTPATGGLLRETGLMEQRSAFDRRPWLQAHGIELQPGERLAVLFCYTNPALPDLLQMLAEQPTLLALTPGPAQQQVHRLELPGSVRTVDLPWLPQTDFDRLLWSADLNFVRGEDSLVRSIWAGQPFLWQLYPQTDGVHGVKSHAFLRRLLESTTGPGAAQPRWARQLQHLWNLWNGQRALEGVDEADGSTSRWPDHQAWRHAVESLRGRLLEQPDLSTQLMQFVAQHPPPGPQREASSS
ncbi:MAG: elongation factor P maturation arginine rhamnosyltransferase EarP [Rubrivivax sp.]